MAARSAMAMGDDGLPQRYQSGDFLPVSAGGTGATTAAGAVTNLIGYQPAMPVSTVSATFANASDVNSGSSYAVVNQTGFTATATNMAFRGGGQFNNGQASAQTGQMYVDLYDTVSGSVAATGNTEVATVASGGTVPVKSTGNASGLTAGRRYNLRIMATRQGNVGALPFVNPFVSAESL